MLWQAVACIAGSAHAIDDEAWFGMPNIYQAIVHENVSMQYAVYRQG